MLSTMQAEMKVDIVELQQAEAFGTSWDTYYPGAERGKNLHNIAIEGMKVYYSLRYFWLAPLRLLRVEMSVAIFPVAARSTCMFNSSLHALL